MQTAICVQVYLEFSASQFSHGSVIVPIMPCYCSSWVCCSKSQKDVLPILRCPLPYSPSNALLFRLSHGIIRFIAPPFLLFVNVSFIEFPRPHVLEGSCADWVHLTVSQPRSVGQTQCIRTATPSSLGSKVQSPALRVRVLHSKGLPGPV